MAITNDCYILNRIFYRLCMFYAIVLGQEVQPFILA